MNIKNVIVTAAEEVIQAVDEARKDLVGVTVDYPTRIEIEFGINSSYEIANYDDFGNLVAKVRVSVPLFKGRDGKEPVTTLESPATAAIAEEKKNGHGNSSKKENGKKAGPKKKP